MTRHSFIQMSKLYNVKGRISYITSHARQENLYATYRTADNSFWRNLAKECQQEFKRSNSPGKCIEARELIIALPEVYTTYEPQQVLEDFTEEFRRRYNVECVSALHHNKRKTNYHIHLIFSERRLLAEPDIKIATRSVFYDETGKRVRTKKEITDESGKVRETKGIFKGKERKALETQIQQREEKISAMLETIPDILKDDGYPDVQAFMATYCKAEVIVNNYNRELAEWERKVKEKSRPAEKERYAPPEKQSVRDQLRRLQAEGRQTKPKHRSHDRER